MKVVEIIFASDLPKPDRLGQAAYIIEVVDDAEIKYDRVDVRMSDIGNDIRFYGVEAEVWLVNKVLKTTFNGDDEFDAGVGIASVVEVES